MNLRHADAVVFNKIGDLTVHGKSIGIEADGFVGAANVKGSPAVVGISLLWHHQLVDQIQIVFGVGGSMTGGKWAVAQFLD